MKNKYIKILLIPTMLLLFGVILAVLFAGISISTISHVEKKSDIKNFYKETLRKGDKITGTFIAKKPYLGILEVRFEKYEGVNYSSNDRLEFILKETGSNRVYYVNEYTIDPFEKSFILPFGFPIIKNSEGKSFDFEIISLYGNRTNSVKLSNQQPILQTVYKYPKSDILSPKIFPDFFYTKMKYSLVNLDFILSSVTYFIPLIAYLIWMLFKNRIDISKRAIAYVLFILIILDCFILPAEQEGVALLLLGVWIIILIHYRLESSVTFLISMVYFTLLTFMIIFNFSNGQDKLQFYIYSFFVIGVIQSVFETNLKYTKLVNYRQFLNDLVHHEK